MGCSVIYFSAMEVRSVFINSPHTWEAHNILPPSFRFYCYYFKVNIVGFHKHFELDRPANCKINRWVSSWRAHERHCSICHSQTSSPWNGLFPWVILGNKFLWCHLSMTLFRSLKDFLSNSIYWSKQYWQWLIIYCYW